MRGYPRLPRVTATLGFGIQPLRGKETTNRITEVISEWSLRKTCATYYDAHMPESSIEILGHSVGGVTYRHYAHRDPLAFKAIMSLLRDASASIQFEAFHVFKIFVANPRKEPSVHELLVRNRERLLTFLDAFLVQRDDDNFRDEKNFLLDEIRKLPSMVR